MEGVRTFQSYLCNRYDSVDGVSSDIVRARETELNDKIAMRKHVADAVAKCYHVGNIDDCPFESLPSDYVVKPRCRCNGEGITFVVNGIDESTNAPVDPERLRTKYRKLKSNRGLGHDVLVEELLLGADRKRLHEEYKAFVFNGTVCAIAHSVDINTPNYHRYVYTPDWERVSIYKPHLERPLDETTPRPERLSELVAFAERVGGYYRDYVGVPFVRVDMYLIDGRPVILGEFTPAPSGGDRNRSFSEQGQLFLGDCWAAQLLRSPHSVDRTQ